MWYMQPLWALSIELLDALEEIEMRRLHAEAPKAKAARVRSSKTLGASSSPVTRPKGKPVQTVELPWLTAGAYTELIEGHFARSVYIA